jgi:hypothetical protein
VLLGALGFLWLYVMIRGQTGLVGDIISTGSGAIVGIYTEISTAFTAYIWGPLMAGDPFAIFAVFGIGCFAAVCAWNFFKTRGRGLIR